MTAASLTSFCWRLFGQVGIVTASTVHSAVVAETGAGAWPAAGH